MAEQYRRMGFSDFKVKLSGDAGRDREKMAVVRELAGRLGPSARRREQPLAADADDAIAGLRRLGYPFFAIEEPIGQNRYAELLADLATALDCPIILDESCSAARVSCALLASRRRNG